jgi:glutamine synthetase adenylyltransferase
MSNDAAWQSELDGLIDSRLATLRALDAAALDAAMAHPLGRHLPAVLAISDYAFEQWRRHPQWLAGLGEMPAPPELNLGEETRWPDQIRAWRHQRSIDLILRDVAGVDRVQDSLRGSSEQADLCCQWALDALYASMIHRHGVPRSSSGEAQALVVFGLGKLGGSELNFSSDIDLVFAFPEQGETDGARPLDNETFFVRLGQQFIKLLGDTTAQGFGFRSTCACARSGRSGDWRCPSMPWSSISSARGATGSATPGSRRAPSRATLRRASAFSAPCGPSSIDATSTTPRLKVCAK